MVTTRPPKTIVKPTALGPVANTDTKLLIYSLFQKGRVLAQDGVITSFNVSIHSPRRSEGRPPCCLARAGNRGFNPLPPPKRGETPRPGDSPEVIEQFQSTPPAEARGDLPTPFQ